MLFIHAEENPVTRAAANYIAVGQGPAILDQLMEPATVGVVWQGAFTAPSLRFIAGLVRQPKYNEPGEKIVPLASALAEHPDQPGVAAFAEALAQLSRPFLALGRELLGMERLVNFSRIESPVANGLIRSAGRWHSDKRGPLVGLAVPAGITSAYLPLPVPGRFDEKSNFHPVDAAAAASAAHQLEPGDFLVFKAWDFPFPTAEEYGLVHCRPNDRLDAADSGSAARAVIHFKLGLARPPAPNCVDMVAKL